MVGDLRQRDRRLRLRRDRHGQLKLAVAADGALTITDWNGGAVDTAQVSWEVSDASLGSVVNGRLVRTGKPGWLTVRGVVTLEGVPRYSSVELVKTAAGQA